MGRPSTVLPTDVAHAIVVEKLGAAALAVRFGQSLRWAQSVRSGIRNQRVQDEIAKIASRIGGATRHIFNEAPGRRRLKAMHTLSEPVSLNDEWPPTTKLRWPRWTRRFTTHGMFWTLNLDDLRAWWRSHPSLRNHIRKDSLDPLVYLLSAGDSVKIGVSGHLWRRLRSIQHMCPISAYVEAIVRSDADDSVAMEAMFHRKFAHLRQHGEWFARTGAVEEFLSQIRGDHLLPALFLDQPPTRERGRVPGRTSRCGFDAADVLPLAMRNCTPVAPRLRAYDQDGDTIAAGTARRGSTHHSGVSIRNGDPSELTLRVDDNQLAPTRPAAQHRLTPLEFVPACALPIVAPDTFATVDADPKVYTGRRTAAQRARRNATRPSRAKPKKEKPFRSDGYATADARQHAAFLQIELSDVEPLVPAGGRITKTLVTRYYYASRSQT